MRFLGNVHVTSRLQQYAGTPSCGAGVNCMSLLMIFFFRYRKLEITFFAYDADT